MGIARMFRFYSQQVHESINFVQGSVSHENTMWQWTVWNFEVLLCLAYIVLHVITLRVFTDVITNPRWRMAAFITESLYRHLGEKINWFRRSFKFVKLKQIVLRPRTENGMTTMQ